MSHKQRWAENGADDPCKSQAIPHLVAMTRSAQRAKLFSTALMCFNPLIALGARQKSPFKIYPFGVGIPNNLTLLGAGRGCGFVCWPGFAPGPWLFLEQRLTVTSASENLP